MHLRSQAHVELELHSAISFRDCYASLELSNHPRASITPRTHANPEAIVNLGQTKEGNELIFFYFSFPSRQGLARCAAAQQRRKLQQVPQ